MDIYRRAGVFERLFSLYSSPSLTGGLRKKVLHLVYRVCEIGGSTTLITRAAALSWVQGQAAISDAHSSTLRALATELYRTVPANGLIAGVALRWQRLLCRQGLRAYSSGRADASRLPPTVAPIGRTDSKSR